MSCVFRIEGSGMVRVAVVGGGPAGMMAALTARRQGAGVVLIEKNEKLGKKLYITGKGRCNLTNGCGREEFFRHILSNPKFLYSAFSAFDNTQIRSFFEEQGVRLKEERGMRVFPASDKSSDIIRALEKALAAARVTVRLNTPVRKIEAEDGGFALTLGGGDVLRADRVILAAGGLSYPATGSTGDGFVCAKEFGHRVSALRPGLVPLRVSGEYPARLEGLTLKNVSVSFKQGKKLLFTEFGDMLFTHNGVSGPVILHASSVIGAALEKGPVTLEIDLKPALTAEELDRRVLRDFTEFANRDFRNALGRLLPASLIPVMVEESGIAPDKKVNEITRAERQTLCRLLKAFTLTVTSLGEFREAIITCGGVSTREVDPKTMESKLVPGLYFAGEMLDLDGTTGGFNLQIAWSTGYAAGLAAAVPSDPEQEENR